MSEGEYGFPGLVIFKIGALSVVGAIALFLSVYRPRTGRWLLNFACLTVGAVAVYSCLLLARAANAPPPTTLTDPDAKSEAAQYAD